MASSASLRALGLTARELEVLRLLGEGLSNKDIGARLYLSPRTVERHVASLTAKAGVSRRSSWSPSPPGASALTDGRRAYLAALPHVRGARAVARSQATLDGGRGP